jgi:hypothetical protein
MISKPTLARLAGLLYLIVAGTGGYSELGVRADLIVAGDPAGTAGTIAASAGLFRLAFVLDLINITCFCLVALVLYALFASVNQKVAVAMVVFNAIATAVMSVNMLNHFAALAVATGADGTTALGNDSANALVLLFVDLHRHGYLIAEIFFGLWLLPLGYLLCTSGYFPRTLGVLSMIGCVGYLLDVGAAFTSPTLESGIGPVVLVPTAVAEVSVVLWLLIRGARVDDQRLVPVPHTGP